MAEQDCQTVTNQEPVSVRELKELKKNVSQLDKTEQLEVLKILTKSQGKLTENKNGIFINLASISRETYRVITQFVEYSVENRVRLKNLEKLSEDLFQKSILKKQYDTYEVDDQFSSQEGSQAQAQVPDSTTLPTQNTPAGSVLPGNNTMKTPVRSVYYDDDEFEPDATLNDDAHKLSESLRHEQDPDSTEKPETVVESRPKISGAKARIIKKCKDLTRNNIDNYYYTVSTGNLSRTAVESGSKCQSGSRLEDTAPEMDQADSDTELGDEAEPYAENLVSENLDELTEDIPILE